MNFDITLIDQISHSKTKDLWDICFNPPSYCLKLVLGSCMVFSFGFPSRMFSGAEKDYTALYTMCVCALLLHLQNYKLNQRFYFSGSLNCLWLHCFSLFCSVVKNGIQHFFLKRFVGEEELLICKLGIQKNFNKFNTILLAHLQGDALAALG